MFRLLIPVLLLSAGAASAQSRVYEKDLSGTWKLVFHIDADADGALERIALKAVSGIMDEIDVRFEFERGHRLRVTANAFDEDQEVEYSEWRIDGRGRLVLGESDHFRSEDTVWMFAEGRLVPFETRDGRLERKRELWLERID